jgi:hypothetical protein
MTHRKLSTPWNRLIRPSDEIQQTILTFFNGHVATRNRVCQKGVLSLFTDKNRQVDFKTVCSDGLLLWTANEIYLVVFRSEIADHKRSPRLTTTWRQTDKGVERQTDLQGYFRDMVG